MIVIAKNTESALLQELKKCSEQSPYRRFFYAGFSKTSVPKQALFESFLKHMQDIPNSYMAQVYICHDLDVFIVMHGFMQRQFNAFLDNLARELNVDHFNDISAVFEVAIDAAKLERIFIAKQDAAHKIQQEKIKQALKADDEHHNDTERKTLDILDSLDPTMVATIAKRRAQRRAQRSAPVVMIADDDQLARTLAGNVLRDDYNLAYAKDGRSALTEFVESAPDVLFLDIGLPDMNGHDVLEHIFMLDPDAYVIMFSGRKDKANMMRALETGAQGFLGKPFTRQKLYAHVEKSPHIDNPAAASDAYAITKMT